MLICFLTPWHCVSLSSDEGNSVRLWRVTVSVLNKESLIADKGWLWYALPGSVKCSEFF
jgi:hypothetical protein